MNMEVVKEVVLLFAMCLPSFMLASISHEMGHFIVGRLLGFKCLVFIAGPLGYTHQQGSKPKFYIEGNLAYWGGLCGMVPNEPKHVTVPAYGWYLFGGPLVSIMVAASCFGLWYFVNQVFFLLLGAMALGMGVASLLPLPNGAFLTDGHRLINLLASSGSRDEAMALWRLAIAQYGPLGSDGMRGEDVAIQIESRKPRNRYYGHYYGALKAQKLGLGEQVEWHREEMKALAPKVAKQLVGLLKLE